MHERLELHDQVRLRLHDEGQRRWRAESIAGQEYWQKAGKWVEKARTVDRQGTRYTECVVDPQSGDVIHECDEPLDAHRNHGSAKHRKSVRRKT